MKPFSPEEDFPIITDKTEAIRISRPQSEASFLIPFALRRKARATQRQGDSESHKWESAWIFADDFHDPHDKKQTRPEQPTVGDQIHDSAGDTWTILRVNYLQAIRCWECETQDLRLRHGLDTWLDLFTAKWSLDVSGVPQVSYVISKSGINAKVVPMKTTRNEKIFAPRYEIFFESWITPSAEDCFVTPDHRRLRILEFHPASASQTISKCLAEEIPGERKLS